MPSYDLAGVSMGAQSLGNPTPPGSNVVFPEHFMQEITTPGTGSFTVPAGVTQIYVECYGAGGAGGGAFGATTPPATFPGGGGGGAYAGAALMVSAGQVIPYEVGAGAAGAAPDVNGGDGGDTTFNTSDVVAAGGKGGAVAGTAGAGGAAIDSTGDVIQPGGSGKAGTGAASESGGGGSGGGHLGAGRDATSAMGALGRTPGGTGGLSFSFKSGVHDGGLAAGGGAGTNGIGAPDSGAGGDGIIRIWFPAPPWGAT